MVTYICFVLSPLLLAWKRKDMVGKIRVKIGYLNKLVKFLQEYFGMLMKER